LIKVVLIFILLVVALILVVVSAGFFISSLYLVLHKIFHHGEIAAALCGAALLLLALLLLLAAVCVKSSLLKLKAPKLKEKIQEITNNPAEQGLEIVKAYPYRSVFTALASGFVLGFFPKVRDHLIDGVVTYMKTGSIADSLKSLKSDSESQSEEE
jgi:hypothetical protein